jgi:hypothetical protein
MLNKKLLEVLQRLQSGERSKLRLFLLSPYFNQGNKAADLIRLYDLIIKYNAEEAHPKLQKASVFALFFPDTPFQEKAKSPLDALGSDLFALVRRFLAQSALEKEHGNEVQEHLAMASFYRKFALEDRFWQCMEQVKKVQAQSLTRTSSFYHDQYKIESEELNFRGLYNSFEDDLNLYRVIENFDLSYSLTRFEYMCALVSQQGFANLEKNKHYLMDEMIMNLSQPDMPFDLPLSRIYRLIMVLIQEPNNDTAYELFQKFIDEYKSIIPENDYKFIMTFQRNFWVNRHIQSSQGDIKRNTFELYKNHHEQGYFYIDGMMPNTTLYNMVHYANLVGEYEWVKRFLDAHPPERISGTRYPKEIYSLCLATYYFATQQYDAAEKTLEYKLFENTFVSLTADILLIRIYYETQNDLLETRMKALDQKIRRTKYTTEKKEQYLNFLRKLDKIIKALDKTQKAKILEEVKAIKGIIARDWLIKILQ